MQKGEGERYKTIQNNTKTGREAKHWGAGSRATMLKVHAAPSFHCLFSPFALAHPHHMHTHTHAAKRTPHSLQLQQCAVALQRICNCCCSFIANAIALKAVQTTTRRARNGPQGWWATVSNAHSPFIPSLHPRTQTRTTSRITHSHAALHSRQVLQCAVAPQRLCNHRCSFCANVVAEKAVHTITREAAAEPKMVRMVSPGARGERENTVARNNTVWQCHAS